MKSIIALTAAAGFVGAANAGVVVSEIHFNTTSTDAEYVEIYNDGGPAVDITGWTFTRYESNLDEGDYGNASTLTFGASVLSAGDLWTLGSAQAQSVYGAAAFDQSFSNDTFENGHSTYVLADDLGNVLWTAFSEDPGEGTNFQANIGGVAIGGVDVDFGVDGTFQVPGYYRTDAAGNFILTDFGNGAPNDPGVANYPVPAPGAAAVLAMGGLVATRRRR